VHLKTLPVTRVRPAQHGSQAGFPMHPQKSHATPPTWPRVPQFTPNPAPQVLRPLPSLGVPSAPPNQPLPACVPFKRLPDPMHATSLPTPTPHPSIRPSAHPGREPQRPADPAAAAAPAPRPAGATWCACCGRGTDERDCGAQEGEGRRGRGGGDAPGCAGQGGAARREARRGEGPAPHPRPRPARTTRPIATPLPPLTTHWPPPPEDRT
jgi:hypothetical protein